MAGREDSRSVGEVMEAQEKYDVCTRALGDYARNAGFTDVLLGLSGGIDSGLVAAMCADAFGSDHVHACLLPGPYSSDHSIADAREEAETLGVQAEVISIEGPYEAFASLLAPFCDDEFAGMASQNTQARCRMVCLMALSNHHGWMLVNTGNKSEAMMGYSTLYGDTAGAFAPIGGLYKTDVYALARARNAQAVSAGRKPPIPENMLSKPPSAELAPGQQDETALGIDYATLDQILIGHFEQGLSAAELAEGPLAGQRTQKEIADVLVRAERQAFKRAVEPPYPQVRFY